MEVSKEIRNMVVIGSGNVAWHLVNAFRGKGIDILQILAHNDTTARNLSAAFNIPYILNPASLVRNADIYMLAVQDDKLPVVWPTLGMKDQFLVHTSGFTSISILNGASSSYGVFWPIQSLTAGKAVSFENIPVMVEANSAELTQKLSRFAGIISKNVIIADSRTRQKAHLAAVVASNLTNRLYAISSAILEREGLPFNLLTQLILETAIKAGEAGPETSQTGPAARNDLQVIEKHLDLLGNDPEFREIYRLISENIIQKYYDKSE
jgi:predicted short-subunit dehydrogenase-like oxidoreductase (DUF2520 family)